MTWMQSLEDYGRKGSCGYNHIAGATSRPTYFDFASTESSDCLSQPKIITCAPALRSSFALGAAAAITVCGVTTIFFSPSLYFTVSISPSLAATALCT